MTQEHYLFARLILAAILLLFGVGLTFGVLPRRLQSTIFDSSRRVMGVAIMVLPIVTILTYAFGLSYTDMNIVTLIYLSSFYLIAILSVISFTSLLGDHLHFRSLRFVRALFGCLVFPIPLATAIAYGDPTFTKIMVTATSIVLCITIGHECLTFYMLYQKAVRRVNNYYSDDLEVDIKWLHNSALLMLSLGFVCCISVLDGHDTLWLSMVITIYRIFVFIFVFFSFMKFIRSFVSRDSGEVESPMREFECALKSSKHDADEIVGISSDVAIAISQRLELWLKDCNYTQKGITINSVSRDVMTNRTYLSSYINSKYHCSFKVWITRMRVEEAKRLLTYSPQLSVAQIASIVSFASTTSFSHAFKQLESIAPIRWRQRNPQLSRPELDDKVEQTG